MRRAAQSQRCVLRVAEIVLALAPNADSARVNDPRVVGVLGGLITATEPAIGDTSSAAERAELVRPVGCADAVGVTGGPLDQLDPVAVWIDDPRRSKVF
jgi:hypothetical protein